MRRRTTIGYLVDRTYIKIKCFNKIRTAKQNAKKRLKLLNGGYKGEKGEFKEVVEAYWKPYGIKPEKYWYQIYCDGKGKFDPRYIPDTMWEGIIYPYFNNLLWGRAYADKCAYDRLFPQLNRPRTIMKNSCGRFYDGNQNIISREEAIQCCLRKERFIVKFTTFTSGGRNIQVYERGEVNEKVVRDLFDKYQMDFIVQELVEQHPDLARIHKESLNTLRVISFYFKGEVHILSAQLRMGSGKARIDNYSSGGYACNVKPDGHLSERAVSKAEGWATMHPCGLAFKDIVVPNYNDVLNVIKDEHPKLPHLNIIGWDFAIGKNGEPIFIELNVTPESNQNGSGPTFGDLTQEVLEEVFINKSLKNAFV